MSKVVSISGGDLHDPREPNESVIKALEDLLDMARSGEMIGFICVAENFDGSTITVRSGGFNIQLVMGRMQCLNYVLAREFQNG